MSVRRGLIAVLTVALLSSSSPAAATYETIFFETCGLNVPEGQLQTNWVRNYRYKTVWVGVAHCGFSPQYWSPGDFVSRLKLDDVGSAMTAIAYESDGDLYWDHGNKVALSLCTWRDTDSTSGENWDKVQCYYQRHDHA